MNYSLSLIFSARMYVQMYNELTNENVISIHLEVKTFEKALICLWMFIFTLFSLLV